MATEKETDGCLEITSIAADWDYDVSKPETWPDNPRLNSIEFHPGATSDKVTIRQVDANGAVRFFAEAGSSTDSRIKYFNGARVKPYIVNSESTLSAGHKVVIELWREP